MGWRSCFSSEALVHVVQACLTKGFRATLLQAVLFLLVALHQPKGSSEALMGKKRRWRSSLCASAVTVGSTSKLHSSAGWDCRVHGHGDPQESNAMHALNLCCNTAGHQHVYSVCRWWAIAWGMEKGLQDMNSARKCNTELQHRTEDVNANVNVNLVQTLWGGVRKRTSFAPLAFQLKTCFSLT